MAKKSYILDTSVYLTDYHSFLKYGNNDIVVPLKVLDEIDKHKKRLDMVGANARSFIRVLDKYIKSNRDLFRGVRMEKGRGLLTVKKYDPFSCPDDLELEDPDNQILATALTEQKLFPKRKVIVVSKDINMRVKAAALGMIAEDYVVEEVFEDVEDLFTGERKYICEDSLINEAYENGWVEIPKEAQGLYSNQFLTLISEIDEKRTALTINQDSILKVVPNKKSAWNLKARNKEQLLAFKLLLDSNIPLVTLAGKAGTGKTLLALAAGLEQVFENDTYKKIIVTKPVEAVGKDIGFLPGTLEEKMAPWLAPIQDNLRYLFNDDRMTLDMYTHKGQIEIEAMTFIRGRSISNAYIIIDEVQNMTQHEIKTVLTRVGEGSKIVLTGDIEQIDNVYIDAKTNGLSYVIEKMKNENISGHVTLTKGERSKVATIAAQLL